MFTGEDLLVVYSKIWENPVYLPLAVGAVVLPILIIFLVLRVVFLFYLDNLQSKFKATIKQIILAVDIPKNNEQNLAAVEQIYVNLTAIKSSPNWIEKYFQGKGPLSISLELVSIDGYIQFLIRTPERYRDLISNSIYSQYPEAEIVQVDDYVNMIPSNIGDRECPMQLWGTEFILDKPSAYPLKTYKHFEHQPSESFNDPLTPLLEAYSRMGPGEAAGLQIILTPLGDGWKKSGADEIKKLFGAVITSAHPTDKYLKPFFDFFYNLTIFLLSTFGLQLKVLAKVEPKIKTMTELTPGERLVLERIQEKLALPSFSTTMRYFYLAKREVYNRNRGVDSIKGAMSQFGQSNLNSFGMHGMSRTDVDYYFVEQRVRPKIKSLASYYKARSRGGATEFFLSTEELATIYHFPTIDVKTPMLPKSMIKKSQPPTFLPTVLEESPAPAVNDFNENGEKVSDASEIKKEDLYNIINSLPGYDFTNKHYEEKFKIADEKNSEPVVEKKVEAKNNKQQESVEKYSPPSNLPFIE